MQVYICRECVIIQLLNEINPGVPFFGGEPLVPLFLNPSNAGATFRPKPKYANIFENHLNPVMLVFIG